MSDMSFHMSLYVCQNNDVSQLAITLQKELTAHRAAYYKLANHFMDDRTWIS
jgi:DNA-binding FadR family transcriptional regulator